MKKYSQIIIFFFAMIIMGAVVQKKLFPIRQKFLKILKISQRPKSMKL